MSLKTRAILVLVIGTVMGASLSLGGSLLAGRSAPEPEDLAFEQARLLAEVMERVKRDYVEPIDDSGRVEELARMLAGADITEKSRDYARTLMAEARSGSGTVH